MAVTWPAASLWGQTIGHEVILARLGQDLAAGRVAHGYLFAGRPGLGKTLVARGFAQLLNCTGDPRPCGRCEGCRAVALGNPGRIQVVVPELQGGQGYRAPLHKIERIRDLLGEISLRSFSGGLRVLVLELAEAVREETANTLLKSLEEPPPGVHFVLTSEQPEALLPTVLSRLRRLDFGPVPAAAIEGWLTGGHGVAPEAARVAAGLAAGRPARALELATNPVAQALRHEVLGQAQALGEAPAVAGLAAAQRLLAGQDSDGAESDLRWRVDLALECLEWWYRDALLVATTGRDEAVVNRDLAAAVRTQADRWEVSHLRGCLPALDEARQLLRRGANTQLVLEVLWLRLARGGGRLRG